MKDKNKKRIGIAAIWSLALSMLSGCSQGKFESSDNEPVVIYGPPEMFEENIDDPDVNTEGETDEDNTSDDEEQNGDFDPSENEPEEIYGPPEMFN